MPKGKQKRDPSAPAPHWGECSYIHRTTRVQQDDMHGVYQPLRSLPGEGDNAAAAAVNHRGPECLA